MSLYWHVPHGKKRCSNRLPKAFAARTAGHLGRRFFIAQEVVTILVLIENVLFGRFGSLSHGRAQNGFTILVD